jgi:hypothetical protein
LHRLDPGLIRRLIHDLQTISVVNLGLQPHWLSVIFLLITAKTHNWKLRGQAVVPGSSSANWAFPCNSCVWSLTPK